MHRCLFCWRWGRGYAQHSTGFGPYYACRRHWPTLYHMFKLWVRAIEQQGAEQLRIGKVPTPSSGSAAAPWPHPWGYKGAYYWRAEHDIASRQDFTR